MFNLKALLLLCFLSFSTQQGQCGRLCLEIWEDEVHRHTFSRVYRVLNDFFDKRRESIKILSNAGFFKKDNYKHPSEPEQNTLISFLTITSNASTIEEDYGSRKGLVRLKSHLSELNTVLTKEKMASDLNDQEFSGLKVYTVALWKIVSALL